MGDEEFCCACALAVNSGASQPFYVTRIGLRNRLLRIGKRCRQLNNVNEHCSWRYGIHADHFRSRGRANKRPCPRPSICYKHSLDKPQRCMRQNHVILWGFDSPKAESANQRDRGATRAGWEKALDKHGVILRKRVRRSSICIASKLAARRAMYSPAEMPRRKS